MRSLGGQTGLRPEPGLGDPACQAVTGPLGQRGRGRRRSPLVSLVDARRRVLFLRHGFAQDRLADRQDAAEVCPGPGGQQLERDRRMAGEQRDPPACDYRGDGQVYSSTRSWASRPFQSCRELDHDGAPKLILSARGKCVAPGQPHQVPYAGDIAPAHRGCGVSDQEGDHACDRLGRDTACALTSAGNIARFLVSSSCCATAFTASAQFDIQNAGQVDKSGLAHAVGPDVPLALIPGGRPRARWHRPLLSHVRRYRLGQHRRSKAKT